MANNQFILFIIYLITGIIVSIVFDIFRTFRKAIKTSNILTYIEDFLFVTIACIFLIIIIFKFSFGELRFYTFIGMILGIIIYFRFISKYVMKLNQYISQYIKAWIEYYKNKIVKK